MKQSDDNNEPTKPVSLSHWGAFEAEIKNGRLISTIPLKGSGADPEMIGAIPDLVYSSKRVDQPYVRAGWLTKRAASRGSERGKDEMIPVDWNTALSFVADELVRVRDTHGYSSIFAGSYGWSSAGRFHHARTQIRRFFGAFGGFTDQTGNYSWGAAQIILKHVLGTEEAVAGAATSWSTISQNTDVLVAFGGLNPKNWRVTSGGAGNHHMFEHISKAARNGTKFIVVSPIADDIPQGIDAEHIAPRPGSDTAIMLGLCYEMIQRGRADEEFLSTYCTGLKPFREYLFGQADGYPKSLSWAAEVSDVSLTSLERLADQISEGRVMLTASWSLQRAHRGEQPFWTLIALAAILGQIGRPGGGFTFGYGSLNAVGEGAHKGLVPSLPTLGNPKGMTIPVARFADMLECPGSQVHFDGKTIVYPDIKIIYWAGGNPFHHSQDLFRLSRLWRRPETVIVHEQTWTATAQRADIVLPATTSLERNDIGGTSRDPHVFFMPKVIEPVGFARNDYDIFSDLSKRLGCHAAFTEGRTEVEWLEYLWKQTQNRAQKLGLKVPDFKRLKKQNKWHIPKPKQPEILLENFVSNPDAHPLPTPSGKIEITSKTIATYAYDDMSAYPEWRTPKEWLGNADETKVALLSRQPEKFLHSQLNQTYLADSYRPTVILNKVEAAKRGLKNNQRVILRSDNGSCIAQLKISSICRDGVAVMETGHHFVGGDDDLDPGGNANALTYDFPTSTLSQATAAQSCLITISRIETL